jgi:hypothetical protein
MDNSGPCAQKEEPMKRSMRKLALNRETLRSLEDGGLREALGGATKNGTCFATICHTALVGCITTNAATNCPTQ